MNGHSAKRLLVVAVCLLVTLAAIALWLDRAGSTVVAPIGKSATELHEILASPGVVYSSKFMALDGNRQALGQWDRKLLIVNFWATWCGPCKEEIPILVRLQTKFAPQGLQIVGIAADSSSNVSNFAKKVNINYPLLIDETGAIEFSKRLGNRLGLLPHTVMFAPGGEIIYNKLGIISENTMSDIIAKNAPIKH